MKQERNVKIYIETSQSELLEVCTCLDDENTIRKIIEAYEDIWGETLENGRTSTDPIINNWEGSTTVVENLKTGEQDLFV